MPSEMLEPSPALVAALAHGGYRPVRSSTTDRASSIRPILLGCRNCILAPIEGAVELPVCIHGEDMGVDLVVGRGVVGEIVLASSHLRHSWLFAAISTAVAGTILWIPTETRCHASF